MNEHRSHHRGGGRGGRRGGPPFGADERPGERGRAAGFGRMRRGDVRSALLIALQDAPGHGYELIQALETKTAGRWRPSPGSVYPSLQLLADEGLVSSTEVDGKRVYSLTDAGREAAESHVAERGYPWDAMDRGVPGGGAGALRVAVRDLHQAARQVGMSGSVELIDQATTIVTDARKALYRLLAE